MLFGFYEDDEQILVDALFEAGFKVLPCSLQVTGREPSEKPEAAEKDEKDEKDKKDEKDEEEEDKDEHEDKKEEGHHTLLTMPVKKGPAGRRRGTLKVCCC